MLGKTMTEKEEEMAEALDRVIKATQDLVVASMEAGYDEIMPGVGLSWASHYVSSLEHLKSDKRALFTSEYYKTPEEKE